MEMEKFGKLSDDSAETPLRKIVLDLVWVVLPCLGIAAISEALGWHTIAKVLGFLGLTALAWYLGQTVRVLVFRKPL